jgi:ABC-2 type transport system ATP-binding protein
MDYAETSSTVNNEFAVETYGLTRRFKKLTAVDHLDLKIPYGELFGLVGPDGAGKTTILRLLAGLYHISDGQATVLDHDLKKQSESVKHRIGYMAQQFSLYDELSVEENLEFFSDLFDVDPSQRVERMKRLLSFAGLTQFRKRPAAQLSGGMQKKLALACTLIHQPDLLLLDEPTTGVDPISRREFWDILGELHLQGTTIIVSTPYMDEADRCSRVGLVYAGKLVQCATPAAIRASLPGELIEIRLSDWRTAIELLQGMQGVVEVQTYGETLRVMVDSTKKRVPKIKKELQQNGIEVISMRIAPARMEDAFISLIHHLEV